MKTKHIIFSLLAVFAITSVLIFNACEKDTETNESPQSLISPEQLAASEAKIGHIQALRERLEYYQDHPELKNGGVKYAANEAVLELESQLNFNYCYFNTIEYDSKAHFYTEVVMPLDALMEIYESDLSVHYFDDVIEAVQNHMNQSGFANKTLMLVDLELNGFDGNNDALVGVTSYVGNQGTLVPALSEEGWKYGFTMGTCDDQQIGEWDAALELELAVKSVHMMMPPPGYVLRWDTIHTEGPIYPYDFPVDDPDDFDNYCDCQVYVAKQQYGNIDEHVMCLSNDVEMPFYAQHYNDLVFFFETQYSLSYINCMVQGFQSGSGNDYQIQHNYRIQLGTYYLVPESWVIEDIMGL